jgi:uncharacterized protein YecA (UPF0149 family)
MPVNNVPIPPNPVTGKTAENASGTLATSGSMLGNKEPETGRNDLCPCGSGKKYKKCHGK